MKLGIGLLLLCGLLSSPVNAATVAADTNGPVIVESSVKSRDLVVPTAWVVSLGGVGSTTTTGNSETVFGVDISIGYTTKLVLPLEAGVRQSISYDSESVFNTRLYADWTLVSFAKDRVDLFVGGNAGATYGDVSLSWEAAPEAGFRLWVKEDVSILFRTEFPFRLDEGAEYTDSLRYFLGFQVKW